MFFDNVLGGDPHMHVVVSVCQRFANHMVKRLHVTHSKPGASVRQNIRGHRHIFRAAGNNNVV